MDGELLIKGYKFDNDIRINIIDDIDIDISERKNLRIDLYWKLLIEYHWFYNYFQRMIA